MITIIEGPDCSGKTTLMRQGFPGAEGYVHEHSGPPTSAGAWSDYTTMLRKLWNARRTMNVVFDRFVYGELIYGPILRPASRYRFTQAHVRMLERVMLGMEGVLITAITDLATSQQLWLERQEQELVKDPKQFRTIHNEFEVLFRRDGLLPNLPTISFDFTRDKVRDIRNQCLMHRSPPNKGPGIGMFRTGVTLMVGERVNGNTSPHNDWPFVAEGESSLWLAQQLDLAEVSEQELYWINAMDADEAETNPSFIKGLIPDRVIALGKSAEIWCKRNIKTKNLPVHAVPHPAFWKRFHSTERYPLHDIIGFDATAPQRELPLTTK